MTTTKQFLFLGPQGSGKGTQAKVLSAILKVPHVSTGDMFRDNVARGTDLGKQIDELLKGGSLVPNEVTNAMVKERLERPDAAGGFVLDGFPRNLVQAEFLEKLAPDITVIYLDLSDEESIRRIAGRRTCSVCGAIYHVDYKPSKIADVCDVDSAKLIQRNDDTEQAVRARLATFHKETTPLLEFYRSRERLVTIDGTPPIPEVTTKLQSALEI